jgi:hypothetical protein
MASEHWKDLHRDVGRFKARPGAKGFRPADPQPPKERQPGTPFKVWVDKVQKEKSR